MEVTCDGQPIALERAKPHQLRLALIEGGLQFAADARSSWEQGNPAAAAVNLGRCRRILAELLRGTVADQAPLTRRISSLYLHLLRQLIDAQVHRDSVLLQQIMDVLEVERQTWQQVCQQQAAA